MEKVSYIHHSALTPQQYDTHIPVDKKQYHIHHIKWPSVLSKLNFQGGGGSTKIFIKNI